MITSEFGGTFLITQTNQSQVPSRRLRNAQKQASNCFQRSALQDGSKRGKRINSNNSDQGNARVYFYRNCVLLHVVFWRTEEDKRTNSQSQEGT